MFATVMTMMADWDLLNQVKRVLFSVFFLSQVLLSDSAAGGPPLVQTAKTFLSQKDLLGFRIYIKSLYKKQLTYSEWKALHQLVGQNPRAGIDLLFEWDQLAISANPQAGSIENKVKVLIETGDKDLVSKNFNAAFESYQKAVRLMKNQYKGPVPLENQPVYFKTMHQMARALYGEKRYDEALTVYSWLPPSYYQFRQVLFEKMWASFQANRYDIAIGAIYSQSSSYFSRYQEPETYLLKIYMLKKLCYSEEIDSTVNEIQKYFALVKANKLNFNEWVKSETLYLLLFNLIQPSAKGSEVSLINQEQRKKEKQLILKVLRARFESEKERLALSLPQVLGYAKLIRTGGRSLGRVSDLPEADVLNKQGFELWNNTKYEEWLDELGSNYFIGESHCAQEQQEATPKEQ
jgi:hypothetical protein